MNYIAQSGLIIMGFGLLWLASNKLMDFIDGGGKVARRKKHKRNGKRNV